MKALEVYGVKMIDGYYCDTCSKDVEGIGKLLHRLRGHKIIKISITEIDSKWRHVQFGRRKKNEEIV